MKRKLVALAVAVSAVLTDLAIGAPRSDAVPNYPKQCSSPFPGDGAARSLHHAVIGLWADTELLVSDRYTKGTWEAWNAYFAGQGGIRTFSDGDEEVERDERPALGLKHDPATLAAYQGTSFGLPGKRLGGVLLQARKRIRSEVRKNRALPDLDIQYLVPTASRQFFSYSNLATIGGILVGGGGEDENQVGEGDDVREFYGLITATVAAETDTEITYQLTADKIRLHIKDAIDFCPGNLGPSAARWFELRKSVMRFLAETSAALEGWGYTKDVGVEFDFLLPTRDLGTVAVPKLPPIDEDVDHWSPPADCDDSDSAINPGGSEVPGNAVDENCDGIVAPGDPVTVSVRSVSANPSVEPAVSLTSSGAAAECQPTSTDGEGFRVRWCSITVERGAQVALSFVAHYEPWGGPLTQKGCWNHAVNGHPEFWVGAGGSFAANSNVICHDYDPTATRDVPAG